MPAPPRPVDLAPYLDHSLLAPGATRDEVERVCDEAREHGFAAVCVNGVFVRAAARRLRGSAVPVAATVGFPLGAMAPPAKAAEARIAVEDGARELDVVVHLGALLAGEDALVRDDLAGVVAAAAPAGALVKVILETGALTEELAVRGARLAVEAGAGYVKTSTGFGPRGATVADVRLLRATVGPTIGVKAAGGIRTARLARDLIEAGATRLGTSTAVALVGGGARGC